jgi:hypothetical protein
MNTGAQHDSHRARIYMPGGNVLAEQSLKDKHKKGELIFPDGPVQVEQGMSLAVENAVPQPADRKTPNLEVILDQIPDKSTVQGYVGKSDKESDDNVELWLNLPHPPEIRAGDRTHIRYTIRTTTAPKRSELRKAKISMANSWKAALEMPESVRAADLLKDYAQVIPGFDEKLAGIFNDPDFQKFLQAKLNIPVRVNAPGYVMLDYHPEIHDRGFVQDLLSRVETLPGVKLAIFGNASEVKTLKNSLTDLYGRIETPEITADQFLARQRRALGVDFDQILQVVGETAGEKLHSEVRAAYLAAVPLSQGTVMAIGFPETKRVGMILRVSDIIRFAFEWYQAVAHSA